jgi:hypothetical protein
MNKPIITNKSKTVDLPVTDLTFKFNAGGGEIRIGSVMNPELIVPGVYHISNLDIYIQITTPKDNDGLWAFSKFSKNAK